MVGDTVFSMKSRLTRCAKKTEFRREFDRFLLPLRRDPRFFSRHDHDNNNNGGSFTIQSGEKK